MRARRSSIFLSATGDGVFVDRAAACRAGPDLLEKRDGALDALERAHSTIGASFEARRRLGLQPQLLARPADASGIEKCALEHDDFRRVADLGTASAHDARHRVRLFGIRDDQHLRIERAIEAIERPEAFSRGGAADTNFVPCELVEIERVHRLAELEQHVVGDVDDVVDRANAGGLQPRRQPGRRRRDGDVGHGRGIARTQVRRIQLHCDIGRRCRWQRLGHERFHRQRIRRADLAREADDAERVRPVGSDFEIEHRVCTGTGSDPRTVRGSDPDGTISARSIPDSSKPRCVSASPSSSGDTATSTKSRSQETRHLHGGNCSRNRRSFS